MRFPAQILSENEITGLRGVIYQVNGHLTRLYADSVLLLCLRGSVFASQGISFSGDNAEIAREAHATPLACGSLVYYPAGTSIELTGKEAAVFFLHLPDRAICDRQLQISLDSRFAPLAEEYQPLLQQLFQMLQTPGTGEQHSALHYKALCQEFCYMLLSRFTQPGPLPVSQAPAGKSTDSFQDILRFVELNYREELRLQDIAASFFYTSSHLSKLFVRCTGKTFSDYLTGLRLSKAMPLLQSNMEIGAISDACGFPNERSFQQAFQKQYHMRPSVYRKTFTAQTNSEPDGEELESLRTLWEMGLFNDFAELVHSFSAITASSSPLVPGSPAKGINTSDSVIFRNAGRVTVGEGIPFDAAQKNNILYIDNCRDLLIDTFQEQIRFLCDSLPYEYIVLGDFLSDDLQIYYSDMFNPDFTVKERSRRRIHYDFTLYNKILSCVKEFGLKPILPLTYTPSFLCADRSHFDPVFHNCISVPYSTTEWTEYLQALFSYLKDGFGTLLEGGFVYLWNVPEVQFSRFSDLAQEDFFHLYQETFHTVKGVLPQIGFASPTISCTAAGLEFCRNFLDYTAEHDCIPARLLFTYYQSSTENFRFPSEFLDCSQFMNSVQECMRVRHITPALPLCMLEYSLQFGRKPCSDGLPGAMFPLSFTLSQNSFCGMGFYKGLDLTTRSYSGRGPFGGTFSLLTRAGRRKPAYYALLFLSRLGERVSLNEQGCCVTRHEDMIQLLVYYSIPRKDWKREFTPENLDDFYNDFPDQVFSIELVLPPCRGRTSRIIREHILTADACAYEEWVRAGWQLDTLLPEDRRTPTLRQPETDTVPQIRTRIVTPDPDNNSILYKCRMTPFEIRFVEVL